MPEIEDSQYSNYPFIIARYWSDDDQVLLRIFIHSKLLLEMLADALHLDNPETLRSQDGLNLLPFWGDLQIYLEKKRLEMAWAFELEPHGLEGHSSASVVQLQNEVAELDLLVHGYLENYDIFRI